MTKSWRTKIPDDEVEAACWIIYRHHVFGRVGTIDQMGWGMVSETVRQNHRAIVRAALRKVQNIREAKMADYRLREAGRAALDSETRKREDG